MKGEKVYSKEENSENNDDISHDDLHNITSEDTHGIQTSNYDD